MSIFNFFKKKPQIPIEDASERKVRTLVQTYGFDFSAIDKQDIVRLLNDELQAPQGKNAEYIRALCGYLFCVGGKNDAPLLEKAKYGIDMDVGCMIDAEWIECLAQDSSSKDEQMGEFVRYYRDYI